LSRIDDAAEEAKKHQALQAAFNTRRTLPGMPGMLPTDTQTATTPETTLEAPDVSAPVGYVAFHAKDRVERLRIRLAGGMTRAPAYQHLADIVSDGTGAEIVLLFNFLTVTVSGHNLHGLVSALEQGTADFMQEYDRNRWPKPDDKAAPFIAAIEVMAQGLVAGAGQTERQTEQPAPTDAP
jgi:hypothetical protein